jgi:two-component system, NarL family, response regulator NreC
MAITVLIADDHPVLRTGLRTHLEGEGDLRVVGESGDGPGTLLEVERHRPRVLLLDLKLPGLDGLEVIRQVRQRFPATRVLVYSMWGTEAYVVEALKFGAAGYLLKGTDGPAVVHAVREVAAGRRVLGHPLTERAIESYLRMSREAPEDPWTGLTAREREVLLLAGQGLTSAQIARKLFLGVRTVETHRARGMRKLDLKNQIELGRAVMERNELAGWEPGVE